MTKNYARALAEFGLRHIKEQQCGKGPVLVWMGGNALLKIGGSPNQYHKTGGGENGCLIWSKVEAGASPHKVVFRGMRLRRGTIMIQGRREVGIVL